MIYNSKVSKRDQMNKTILIVDDSEVNVDVIVNILSDYDVIATLDGKSALEIVKKESVDLILLDIMMPELDGYDVCKLLKEDEKTKDIPVIFLSAKHDISDIQKGFELGGIDYVIKPFNPLELLVRVNNHLQLREYQKSLQTRVDEEVEKNRIKDNLLFQQSKQAAFGELLMHISHQWKQPLSELSSINTKVISNLHLGKNITKEDHLSLHKHSQKIIDFMSDTVDTFQNFYKPIQDKSSFYLQDSLDKVLSVLSATLEFDNVKVDISSIDVELIEANINELSQVIFSIISNAREIFKKREIKNPKISILLSGKSIEISDNGGGVDADLLDDIFLPFVSTTKGYGIGLYLSKNIVDKNGGYISVSNLEDGAIFKIGFDL
jgi:two-component system, sensor histidine kinase and response regulator